MIKIIEGNLLDSNANIIIHQCNTEGVMGSGVAFELSRRYPNVYRSYYNDYKLGKLKLGYTNFTPTPSGQIIGNMIAQTLNSFNKEREGCLTDYESLQECLTSVKLYAKENFANPVIALPYKMSCCRGGGDWNVVYDMIEKTFDCIDVEIWRLDKG